MGQGRHTWAVEDLSCTRILFHIPGSWSILASRRSATNKMVSETKVQYLAFQLTFLRLQKVHALAALRGRESPSSMACVKNKSVELVGHTSNLRSSKRGERN